MLISSLEWIRKTKIKTQRVINLTKQSKTYQMSEIYKAGKETALTSYLTLLTLK